MCGCLQEASWYASELLPTSGDDERGIKRRQVKWVEVEGAEEESVEIDYLAAPTGLEPKRSRSFGQNIR